jgi:hypothetical protein
MDIDSIGVFIYASVLVMIALGRDLKRSKRKASAQNEMGEFVKQCGMPINNRIEEQAGASRFMQWLNAELSKNQAEIFNAGMHMDIDARQIEIAKNAVWQAVITKCRELGVG